ncbi:MerR family transcriptional regulator [Streptomyces collinus]|uniref:MerR family transcriptional regulator n=1 Tax=Streptomyces collinus TaxID=42684 RepID=UPI002943BF20|nr:MerR family transcriptional regulator [Streptomyces collinus]
MDVERAEPAPPAEAGLTTGALARRLGVSPTTLRSWERRYGIGPAERAAGRHRRWTPRDVAMLETMCRLTSAGVAPAEAARAARSEVTEAAPPPTAAGTSGTAGAGATGAGEGTTTGRRAPMSSSAPASMPSGAVATAGPPPEDAIGQELRGLARAAVRLDAPAVEERLAAAADRHGLIRAWQEVMVPSLHVVGRKWASAGDRYVEVEHLLSWHVSTVLRRHTLPPVAPPGPAAPGPVLLACVPGEQHTLPLEALNAGLSRLGIPTRMFAGAVPAEALSAAVRRLGPAAVVLWAQARSTASLALAQHVAATEWGVKGARSQPLVVLGGPGWAGRPGRGMLRPTSLAEALDALSVAHRYRS